jgi:sterol desaturase/sphingolipid hydroxylase (fatty acid hydroxylase superfamily)
LAIGRVPDIVADVRDLLLYKGFAVGVWLAFLFLAERLWPAAPLPDILRGAEPQRLGRNLSLAAINFMLSPLVVLPLTALAAGHALPWRPGWWQGWPGLALDLLLLDGLIYWWHRANHEWRPLWRFHRVHHLDRTLDATTALRFHFGEVLLSALARAGVVVLIGFPLASVVVFESLVLIAAAFHHSNLRLPPRLEQALSRLVITPAIHWVHHRRRQTDTDSNYGTIFSFWDRIFRTVSPTRRRLGMEIGVQGAEELGLIGLFLRPLDD